MYKDECLVGETSVYIRWQNIISHQLMFINWACEDCAHFAWWKHSTPITHEFQQMEHISR